MKNTAKNCNDELTLMNKTLKIKIWLKFSAKSRNWTSLSSAIVSWRTLIGYPSYARSRACALPSPPPFRYVMAKIVPAMQLATHAKMGNLYGRSVERS